MLLPSEYSNSMPFNIDLETTNQNFDPLIDTIENNVVPLVPAKQYTKRHYSAHLRLILLNLLKAYRQNRHRYVAYSRNRNTYYPQKTGANGLKISYEPFGHILQILEDLGLITTKSGYNFPGGHCSNARMRATVKLKELFRSARDTFPNENRIVLKDAEKNYLSYTETPAIRLMRSNLELINNELDRHFIGLYVPDEQHEKINKKRRRDGKGARLDFSKTVLHRTFSRGSFTLGGRFHGGFWIPLPKAFRQFVRIDHQETTLVDFSATVFSLIYLDLGLPVPEGDAYLFPGADPRDREVLKLAAQMMVNTTSRAAALKAINFDLLCRKFTHQNYTAVGIMTELEATHPTIKEMFYRDLGVKYQRIESDIAEAVMLRFVPMKKAVLPVHDGFLVKREDRQLLELAMTEEVVNRYGHPMSFKAETPSNVAFVSGKEVREAYSEYFKLWDEWSHEHQREREASQSLGLGSYPVEAGGIPLAAKRERKNGSTYVNSSL
jgi:hypothetical protein